MRNMWLILGAVAFISCASGGLSIKNWDKFGIDPQTPNNMVKLDTNRFIDFTELTNGDWLDYMSWLEYMYGLNSDEYLSAVPDSGWAQHDPQLAEYDQLYLKYPAFRKHPVVGITYDQAINYLKWRGDITFEKVLVDMEAIMYDPGQTGARHFTIEKYLNGDWYSYEPDTNLWYPVFELPTEEDWELAMEFGTTYHYKNLKKCKDPCGLLESDTLNIISAEDVVRDQWGAYLIDPTTTTSCDCSKDVINHLYGNVRELSAAEGYTLGGGWTDMEATMLSVTTFRMDSAVPYVGFRAVAHWEKYDPAN